MAVISTKFLAEAQRRAKQFSGKKVAARIRANEDTQWWAYLEFGTALRGENPAYQRTYPIDPVNAKMLSWPGADGGRVFRSHVDHPGIHPHLIVRSVLKDIRTLAGAFLAEHLSGADTEQIRLLLLQEVMPQAKTMIVESIAERVTGTREDGKLHGQTAADAFAAGTTIEDTSDSPSDHAGNAESWMAQLDE